MLYGYSKQDWIKLPEQWKKSIIRADPILKNIMLEHNVSYKRARTLASKAADYDLNTDNDVYYFVNKIIKNEL